MQRLSREFDLSERQAYRLWFAKILSARNWLTRRVMDGKNRRHATAFTVRVSIRPLAPQWASDRCDRERSATNADSSVSTKTEAPSADDLGSDILGRSPQRVVRLATSLAYVQADTVVRWQRERFRKFWARLSNPQRQRRGRPGTAAELRRLIEQIAAANPLWRAPRIHGELQMLGIAISERTVSRILRRLRRPPNQTWRTFLPTMSAKWSPSISLPCPQLA
jgi:transposase